MCIYSTNSTDGSYHREETWNWLGARRLHRHIYMYYFCQLQVNCKLSFMHQQYRIMNNQLMAHNTAENLERAGLCCTGACLPGRICICFTHAWCDCVPRWVAE